MNRPASELTEALEHVAPGRALDLACGSGRHAIWLRDHGWDVTGVDLAPEAVEGVTTITADLESGGYTVEAGAWDLIVCWLYWQENLLPSIDAGVKAGGMVALAGKLTGRFATSLGQYRRTFAGWEEIASGEDGFKAFFIARKPRGE